LGRTVFEIKSDLVRERTDAEKQLLRYLPQRELETGQRFTGIATDGADFRVYIVRDNKLVEIGSFKPDIEEPAHLLAWLESVVVLTTEIRPSISNVRQELGRESVAYHRALDEIERLWESVASRPEVNLKRDLWNRLIRVAYGGDIDAPALFFQHTYLTIVAKAIATVALHDRLPSNGRALLEGSDFSTLGILGAVEADFFDWILLADGGDSLVMRIAHHANRFRLRDIEVDILKGLYESLIDPDQRHDLGEYYTPDWLAARICKQVINRPLEFRVIDPACGSGTFLFHAIREVIAAAKTKRLSAEATVALAIEKVAGIDVHPVAVIFARVTYLLALMPVLQKGRPSTIVVPVYLGDALQWNAREFMNFRDLEIVVPAKGETLRRLADEEDEQRTILRFPFALASEPGRFDRILDEMLSLASRNEPAKTLSTWFAANGIEDADARMLLETYEALRELEQEGRNHIWGYVARNLSRPIWLASERQKADVVIGNPPWLDYRSMNKATQSKFQGEMRAIGIWDGKIHGVAFDLSTYFFARSIYLYMKSTGEIAFVMPFASLSRKSYKLFRDGSFAVGGRSSMHIQFTEAWAFPSDVQPLFPVPSAVLFAKRSPSPRPLPSSIKTFSGELPRRDAHPEEAARVLKRKIEPWPSEDAGESSPYLSKFHAGAKLDPRRLILVEKESAGRLGANPSAPVVKGRTGNLDKKPWKSVEPPRGAVEAEFIRTVYLGESIGPFSLFAPVLAVIPWDAKLGTLLDSRKARNAGYPRLASWLEAVEGLWKSHGKGSTTFAEKINFYGLLTSQFPIRGPRVVYSKSGTNPAAAIVRDNTAVIDHMLYWLRARSLEESYYLAAILNSEAARRRVAKKQAQGQWGARHFDKVMLSLPIPTFDPGASLHQELVSLAEQAEKIAAAVPIKPGLHFVRARSTVRQAIGDAGVSTKIDSAVDKLLGSAKGL